MGTSPHVRSSLNVLVALVSLLSQSRRPPQKSRQNKEQAALMKIRDDLCEKWQDEGRLHCARNWSEHSTDDKLYMVRHNVHLFRLKIHCLFCFRHLLFKFRYIFVFC